MSEPACRRIGSGGGRRPGETVGTATPVDDFGLVDVVALVVRGRKTGRRADGAPRDPAYALRRGFPSRAAYARSREDELTAALAVLGIPRERTRSLDIVDGETAVRSDIDDMGLLGSAVLGDKVTELLDVRAAILAADPAFYTTSVQALPTGGVMGLVSGIVGVGGGIFLSPLMILLRWADAKRTAAVSAACCKTMRALTWWGKRPTAMKPSGWRRSCTRTWW